MEQNSFAAHPYKRGVIGSIADLDSANIEDVRKFHATYYRPDNATLIVAGDFDPGTSRRLGGPIFRTHPQARDLDTSRHGDGTAPHERGPR